MDWLSFFAFFFKPPVWSGPLPQVQEVGFALDRLSPGVDNFNYDVHLSPDFRKSVGRIIYRHIIRQAGAEEDITRDSTANPAKDRIEFNRLCRELFLEAVNRAKMQGNEVQIDFLARTAVVKFLGREIRDRVDLLLNHYNNIIWENETARTQDLGEIVRLREKLTEIRQAKGAITVAASRFFFTQLAELQQRDIDKVRRATLGTGAILAGEIFFNPLLYVDKPVNDTFMIQEYVLLGHRYEDPDKYPVILALLQETLSRVFRGVNGAPGGHPATDSTKIAGWLRNIRTPELLFDPFATLELYNHAKKDQAKGEERRQFKKLLGEQRRLLNYLYRRFKKDGLIDRIVGSFFIKPLCDQYCPPLVPHQLLHFLIEPAGRNRIVSQLRWVERLYGKTLPLAPLRQAARRFRRAGGRERRELVVRYLKQFVRYHRDLENHRMLREISDRVNLATAEELIDLSRANHTLHEFLLPHEKVLSLEEKMVSGHTILKADVRGATIITSQLQRQGLNPASYFSLNFFGPIAELLSEYNAVKVFIEGDAIILSFTEHEDTPAEWYGVARACGLAVNMLRLIRQYNSKNRKYRLPIMELGIGISYQQGGPSFLFDGERQIMISPAINLADRLSSCDKTLRRLFEKAGHRFNLFVFYTEEPSTHGPLVEPAILRYNVNGIELHEEGFKKLGEEIELRRVELAGAETGDDVEALYTGKFPTLTGRYQRLVVRQARAGMVNGADPGVVLGRSAQRYYEICTQPWIYEATRMAD